MRFFAVVVAGLAVVVGGLGLAASRGGGPSVVRLVLTPAGGAVGPLLPQKLEDAAKVLRLRVAAVDQRGEVKVEGGRLIVTAPGSAAAQVRRLGSPGELQMRPVLAQDRNPTGCPAVHASALDQGVIACSQDDTVSYQLGPARLTGTSVKGAEATDVGAQSQVVVQLTTLGQKQFTQLTRDLLAKPAPQNELAIVIDGVVLSAPEVRAVIIGDTQISGGLNYEQAQALALIIRYGALPIAFAISEG